MITTLKIENFRLFKNLEIKDLKRVNLFAGKNNSGKTALLEALRISAAGEDLTVMRYILQQRGENLNNFWEFYDSFFYRPLLDDMRTKKDEMLRFRINNFRFQRKYEGERNVQFMIFRSGGNFLNTNTLLNNLPSPLSRTMIRSFC